MAIVFFRFSINIVMAARINKIIPIYSGTAHPNNFACRLHHQEFPFGNAIHAHKDISSVHCGPQIASLCASTCLRTVADFCQHFTTGICRLHLGVDMLKSTN
jgi:hypothetical protein